MKKIYRVLIWLAIIITIFISTFIIFYLNLSFLTQKAPSLVKLWTGLEQRYYKSKKTVEISPSSTLETITFPSVLLGDDRSSLVYLPPEYSAQLKQKYPVVYLLHGSPGSKEDWIIAADLETQLDSLISEKVLPPMIIVMTDGSGKYIVDSQYVDSTKVKQPMEDYIVTELVPYIDNHYRTLTDRRFRAIGGNSSGAYGAVNVGLHHPDIFAIMISHSGYFINKEWAITQLLGNNTVAWHANNPAEYIKKLTLSPETAIYIEVGKIDFPAFIKDNQLFAATLTAQHIEHVYTESDGIHSWSTWKGAIRQSLTYAASKWRQWGLDTVK